MKVIKLISIIVGFLILVACSAPQPCYVYSENNYLFRYFSVYPLKDSTIFLVSVGGKFSPEAYSFHSIDHSIDITGSRFLLQNLRELSPAIKLFSNEKDSVFSIHFIDKNGMDIKNTNPFISINNSIKTFYRDYYVTLNFFENHKIDSVYTLNIQFPEGFDYSINNLHKGKIVFQIDNYEGYSSFQSIFSFHKNYYLSSLNLNQAVLSLEDNSKQHGFIGLIEIKKKEFKRIKQRIGKQNFPQLRKQ